MCVECCVVVAEFVNEILVWLVIWIVRLVKANIAYLRQVRLMWRWNNDMDELCVGDVVANVGFCQEFCVVRQIVKNKFCCSNNNCDG